jgi:hypothetical protein
MCLVTKPKGKPIISSGVNHQKWLIYGLIWLKHTEIGTQRSIKKSESHQLYGLPSCDQITGWVVYFILGARDWGFTKNIGASMSQWVNL